MPQFTIKKLDQGFLIVATYLEEKTKKLITKQYAVQNMDEVWKELKEWIYE